MIAGTVEKLNAAGHPAVASEWFHLLREKAPHEVQPADVEGDAKGWEQHQGDIAEAHASALEGHLSPRLEAAVRAIAFRS
jgi:hypothetical protein